MKLRAVQTAQVEISHSPIWAGLYLGQWQPLLEDFQAAR
jgi:hypothetical protein